jgi:mRNA-degrading endonuclease RelE of RelBE toxin-antitoxin system
MYKITYVESVADDLKRLSAGQRKRILNQIEGQLTHEPTRQTRNKKILVGLVPPWQHMEPVWELRIGEYRVFYDVGEAASVVIIRAVRHKPPHKTTEEIL